jgi:AraC family transcriptional regulator, transcriptional activator of pobA
MIAKNQIPSFELLYLGQPTDFVLKRVQDGQTETGYREDLPHRHNYYTVLWPIEMEGVHIIDYKEYSINQNDIFFVGPEQVHQVLLGHNRNGVLLMFTCNFLGKHFINKEFITNLGLFLEVSESPPVKVDNKSAVVLKTYTDEIESAFGSNDPFRFEKIGAFLKLFLIECNKFAPSLKDQNPQNIQSSKTILFNFKELLNTKFKTLKQVGDYAGALNISPDYLNLVVKNGVGKTAKELIQQRILLESKRLGLHTGLSTKEIAYDLGFDDPSHFSRFFKNAEGISFSEFRKSLESALKY